MSSLSNLPYCKILDYWYEKLSGTSYSYKFLLTKTIEIFTFRNHSSNVDNRHSYFDFPVQKTNSVPDSPKLSLVVPTFIRNQKDKNDLLNLLHSIEKQTLKPNKVIIVDDCSPMHFEFPDFVKVFRLEQNSGPAKVRNIGKKLSIQNGSDIIAFTDTDCILSEDWIFNITKSFHEHKEFQILSGNTPSYDDCWFGKYHDINGTLNGRQIKETDKLLYGTTANLAITKEVAKQIDFNEKFPTAAGEDIEFCFRANKQGFAIKYIPTMIVFHNYGYNGKLIKDVKRFRQQFKKYGQGETILLKEIPNYYAYFDRSEEITTIKNGP